MSKFQDIRQAFVDAKEQYKGYFSECVYFASAFSRALVDEFGWPRELVSYERASAPGQAVPRIEDAMVLGDNSFWHICLRLRLQEKPSAEDPYFRPPEDLQIRFRFKKVRDRFLIEAFAGDEYEVVAPTAEAFQPFFEALYAEMRRHYEQGLTLFLDGRAGKLKVPFAPPPRTARNQSG